MSSGEMSLGRFEGLSVVLLTGVPLVVRSHPRAC
jgi:hypothetical protein